MRRHDDHLDRACGHALLAVVEKLIVIDFGKKIAEGDPKAIMESPEVKEIYLGVDPDV